MFCSNLKSVVIPSGVTEISYQLFCKCYSLTSVTILDSVTSFDFGVFRDCNNLTEITCLASTQPEIEYDTFFLINEGGTLKVPSGSDYSTWMSTNGYYLGYYNWNISFI